MYMGPDHGAVHHRLSKKRRSSPCSQAISSCTATEVAISSARHGSCSSLPA